MLIEAQTPQYAAALSDAMLVIARELDVNNATAIVRTMEEANQRGDLQTYSMCVLAMLRLQFGLCSLSQHAATLHRVATDEEFARNYWRNIAIN